MLQIEVLSSQRLTTSRMSIDLLLDDLELVDYTDNGVDLVIQARPYMTLNQKPEMISGYMVDIDMLTKWLESDDF